MSVYFNGRKLVSPTTAVSVDDSAMASQSLAGDNVTALIGKADGGEPNKVLTFTTPDDAKSTLRGGELLTAVLKAFAPSNQTNGPSSVAAVRVDPATQASLTLKDSLSADVITLKSTDYGLYTNQIKVKIESGTNKGKKLTTQLGDSYYADDDVARELFSVLYGGTEATATISVSGTQVILAAPAGTVIATIDLDTYNTVDKLVNRINTAAGFTATAVGGQGSQATLNTMDTVTAQSVITTAFTVTGNLQAIVDWFNGSAEGYISATRAAGAGTVPANLAYTYLTGGSNGVASTTDWSNAYTTLQSADVNWVAPVSSDSAIHAMNDAHCVYMSTVARSPRRGFVGTALGTTDAAALAAARALNSDRTALVHLGFYDYNDDSDLALYPPYILAAMIAGAFSGISPGVTMTNKTLKLRGLERKLRNPADTDALDTGGVLCVEDTPSGYKVVHAITTWLTNTKHTRREISAGAAVDSVVREVQLAVDVLRGEPAGPITLGRAVSITESTLRALAKAEPNGPGTLVGDDESPAYKDISARLSEDVIRIKFQCSPVIPANYVLVEIAVVPYSGSASA